MINDSFLINGSFLNYLRSKGLIGSSNPIISEFSVLSYETHIGADSRMVIPVLYGKIRKWEAEIKEMKKDIRSDTRQLLQYMNKQVLRQRENKGKKSKEKSENKENKMRKIPLRRTSKKYQERQH